MSLGGGTNAGRDTLQLKLPPFLLNELVLHVNRKVVRPALLWDDDRVHVFCLQLQSIDVLVGSRFRLASAGFMQCSTAKSSSEFCEVAVRVSW